MKLGKKILGVALSGAMLMSVAACGGNSSSSSSSSSEGKVELKVWAWEPTLTDVAKKFEKKYPNITVKIQNVGTATEQYTALNNAISAGSGAPDIAQIEYYAVTQYAVGDSLTDLSDLGASKYSDFYTPGTWNSVKINDGIYGLPLDSGPMALFYNKEIFDKAGVKTPPTNMEEYYEAAKKIHALGKDYYITADTGEPAPEELLMWAAGGHPFKVDGDSIKIDLANDSGAKEFAKYWQKLVDEGLVDTKSGRWTDQWSRNLNKGKIASLTIGAWMASMLDDNAPDGAGKWRVAETPSFGDTKYNGEDGGSSLAIMKSSEKADAAWKFIDFASHDSDGIKTRVDKGQFPADKATLASSDFQNKTDSYFGDQKFNSVLSKAADSVYPDWQFLPYEVYARTIYGDSFGPAALKKTTYAKALQDWQKKLVDYGNQQGYKVNQ